MRHTELLAFDSVKRWIAHISGKSGSESTRQMYLLNLERWCAYTGKTPDEMIKERMEVMSDKDLEFAQKFVLEELLNKAFNEMEEKGYSRASCGLFFSAVKSFFSANYNPLHAPKPAIWPKNLIKVPNQGEIRLIWEQADPRIRLWILSQKDSGISQGDLIGLTLDSQSNTFGTVRDQLKSGQVPLHVSMMRGKVKALGFYDTYFGEEAFNALQEAQIKEDGRLFDMTSRYVRMLIPKYAKRAGIKGPRVTSHSLRKFFKTYVSIGIRNYGATELLTEYWMGHTLGKVKGAYFAPPVEEQAKIYTTAYPMLRCLGSTTHG